MAHHADHGNGTSQRRNRWTRAAATTALLALGAMASPALTASATASPAISLGAARTYSVLGTAVTSSGATSLAGNLGLTPGTALTGFEPGSTAVVHGATHIADAHAAQAASDALLTYQALMALPSNAPITTTLGGQTFTPGVYDSVAALTMPANTVMTLDGQNQPGATFVFQMGAAVTLGASTTIRLINGADASRVFWPVVGAVTIGASATFVGTLLNVAAITIGADATVRGRVFSLGFPVTLSNNVFSSPTPPIVVSFSGGPTRYSSALTPAIAGSTNATPGSTVSLSGAGQTLSTTVQPDGTWSVTPAAALNAGAHDLVVLISDDEGNVGTQSQRLTINAAAPVLTIAGDPQRLTNSGQPTINGTTNAAAGTSVTVTVTITLQASPATWTLTTNVLADGTWSVIPTSVLPDGVYDVLVTLTDTAGNSTNRLQNLTIATHPPVVTIAGGVQAATTSPTPTLTGSVSDVPVGTIVELSTTAGPAFDPVTTTVRAAGSWALTLDVIPAGTYAVVATVVDRAGNIGTATQSLAVAATDPVVSVNGGPFATVRTYTPTISGTTNAVAGSAVVLTVGGQPHPTMAAPGGTWSVSLPTLPNGLYPMTAAVTDALHHTGIATQLLTVAVAAPVVTITGGSTMTTTGSTPPMAGSATEVAVGSTVAITVISGLLTHSQTATVGADRTWSATLPTLSPGTYVLVASVADAGGLVGTANQVLTIRHPNPVVTLTGGAAATSSTSLPNITGTTNAGTGASVLVWVGVHTRTTTATGNGSWSLPPEALSNGSHLLMAMVTDARGQSGVTTQLLTITAPVPVVTITGGAAAESVKAAPTVTGTVTHLPAGTSLGLTVTSDQRVESFSTTVDASGAWTLALPALPAGAYTVVASVEDASGNTSRATQLLRVTATKPLVTVTGGGEASTDDTTPTIAGTSTAATGSALSLTVDGQTLGTTVGADGSWSVTPTTLVDGSYAVVATATDASGLTGAATQTLVVATPAVVTILGGTSPKPLYNSTFTILGTAPANTLVTLHFRKAGAASIDYGIVREVRSAADGTWSRAIVANVDYGYFATVGTGRSAIVQNQPTATLAGAVSRVVARNKAVTLSGSAVPGATVFLHFHKPGTPANDYSLVRSVVADGQGRWTRAYVATVDYRLFVSRAAADGPAGAQLYLVKTR